MVRSRQRDILAVLEQRDGVSVSELSQLLSVSEVTIRSDLSELEHAGLLRRTRGGASRPLSSRFELPIEETRKQHAQAKRRIGQAAAALIQDGETIMIDVGSTTSEVARHISPTVSGVTVVTSGLNVALELERLPNLRIVVTGGTLRRLQHSLVSPYGLDLLARFRPDRLFLGCNGIEVEAGVTNANVEEAEIKARMVEISRCTVVVADRSKLGQVAAATVAPLGAVDLLITDARAGEDVLEPLRAAGLQVRAV